MITRTEHGFALNGWEARPMPLPGGSKLTVGESRAAVCRATGLSHKEAAREMNCSPDTVGDYWQTIYFKLDMARGNAIVAINKLVELGALHRLQVLLLALMLGGASVVSGSDIDVEARSGRARGSRITRRASGKRGRIGGLVANSTAMADLDFWTGGNAGDIYTHADAGAAA